jgi:hypothetical protein
MNYLIIRYIQIALAVFFLSVTSTSVWATETPQAVAPQTNTPQAATPQTCPAKKWSEPPEYLIVGAIIIIALFSCLIMLMIFSHIKADPKWSLADALSEEYQITPMNSDKITPQLDKDGKPLIISEMRASSSRVIALVGMIVILLMFIGFGIFALYNFAKTGQMPDSIDQVIKFLLAGLTLFAPYVVNKFSGIFDSLSPKPTR